MKREFFLELLNDIDNDLIEKATYFERKKFSKKIFISAIAACLALCISITAIIGNGYFGIGDIGAKNNSVIFEAQYPENVNKAPFLNDFESSAGIREFYISTLAKMLTSNNGENTVYSPAGLYMLLAMLTEMTYGESQAQILSVLGAENIYTLRINARAVWNLCYSNGENRSLIANSLWIDDSYNNKLNKPILENISEYYYASSFIGSFKSKEYVKKMKSWLNSQTNNFLNDLLSDWTVSNDTIISIISSIYFQDSWEEAFDKSDTKNMTFYTADGNSIQSSYLCADKIIINGYWGEKFIAISKAFENGGSMLFILPDRGYSPDDLLNDEEFLSFMSDPCAWKNSDCELRDIRIPKFDVSCKGDMISALKDLGIENIFDAEKSDFSAVSKDPSLLVNDITQGIRIKIDEQGCEAATYTSIYVSCSGSIPALVKLDRPFIFATLSEDGIPLFAGVINDPTKN